MKFPEQVIRIDKNVLNNADDFGMDIQTNKAIKSAILNGKITSVSVMTTGEALNDAVKFLLSHPRVKVGLHFDITEKQGLWTTVLRLLLVPKMLTYAEKEMESQYQTLKNTGLVIDHIDSHEHIHAFPTLFMLICKFARKHQIPKIRYCNPKFFLISRLFSPEHKPKRALILALYYLDYYLFHKYLPDCSVEHIADIAWFKNPTKKTWQKFLRMYDCRVEAIYHIG
ncbi:MAG: ChbG/HpnK family deacetylase [bacterium]